MKLLFVAFAILFSNVALALESKSVSAQDALKIYKMLTELGVHQDYTPAYNRIFLTEISCSHSSSFSAGTESFCKISYEGNSLSVDGQLALTLSQVLFTNGATAVIVPSLQTVRITNLNCLLWKGLEPKSDIRCSFDK